jgi:hypothetical protein
MGKCPFAENRASLHKAIAAHNTRPYRNASLHESIVTGIKPHKPRNVLYAEWALWAWTVWICLSGIYQVWSELPEIEQMMSDALQGVYTMQPRALLEMTIAGYGLLALLSAWIIVKIGAGKHWARGSLLWGFGLQAVCIAFPPYRGISEYLADIPDLGLQGIAIFLLYTRPGRGWFASKHLVDRALIE